MSDATQQTADPKAIREIPEATILFAGDSGDGMQLTGNQFTLASAYARNDLATLPDFPAEIRAPAGTTYGVSGFQLRFGSVDVRTPGDAVDMLVAMNPAALRMNLDRVAPGGTIVVNTDAFTKRDLDVAGYESNPLDGEELAANYHLVKVPLLKLTRAALDDFGMDKKSMDRSKNMFALGLSLWLYSMPLDPAIDWLRRKFASKPFIRDANIHVLKAGMNFGETTERFSVRYVVRPANLRPGTYRAIRGSEAMAIGFVTASQMSGLRLFYGSYPITPASELLHELSRMRQFDVVTFQAEDEIAAIGSAIGAAFGGSLAVTGTSGPGIALKSEAIGLAVITELPVVIVNVQRGGPSTGLPTKTEQSDLLQAMNGRNGEAPLPVLAAGTPGHCFYAAYEAARLATKYMTPVILLSDGYLATGSEPWRIPDLDLLPQFETREASLDAKRNGQFLPYRRNGETLARPWATPGIAGAEHRIGGLEKAHETGNVSYNPDNHQHMTNLRAEKINRIAREIPPTEINGDERGDLLIVGWGSTWGSIDTAVERARAEGLRVSSIHLRYLNPLPSDLGNIFSRFNHLLVPELNQGQLIRLLRDRFLLPFAGLNKVKGLPFTTGEILGKIKEILSDDAAS